jgi:hypothetical protein
MAYREHVIAAADGTRSMRANMSGGGLTPAVCLPGLTRNAKDFETIAPGLRHRAGCWRWTSAAGA